MDDEAATVIASDSKREPHEGQNRAPWADAAPHLEQDTAGHCSPAFSYFAAIRTSVRIHGWMQH